jgi:hypothetical protein
VDKIEIEVLSDGTLKISTDKVSMPNHANAEALLREIISGMGGQVDRKRKSNHHHHNHGEHTHEH